MAGTGFRIEQGWLGSCKVGAANLAANIGVKFDSDGLLVACGAGDKGIGSVQEAFAAGVDPASFVRKIGGCYMTFSGTVVSGDYVKFTTGGILIADTVSGSTALSVNTVGIIRDANAGNGVCFMEWL